MKSEMSYEEQIEAIACWLLKNDSHYMQTALEQAQNVPEHAFPADHECWKDQEESYNSGLEMAAGVAEAIQGDSYIADKILELRK